MSEFIYQLNSEETGYIIKGFIEKNTHTELNIPNEIEDLPVLEIADSAFRAEKLLETVIISDNVTHIGKSAFQECINVQAVTFSSSVQSINTYAFYKCSNLLNVYYKGTIDDWCRLEFADTYANPLGLGSVNSSNVRLNILEDANSDTYLEVVDLVIPDTVTAILSYAFIGSTIKSVKMSDNVIAIGQYAFLACKELTNVLLSDNISNFGLFVFAKCSKLQGSVPDEVTDLSYYIASNQNPHYYLVKPIDMTISEVSIIKNVIHQDTQIIGDYAFDNCTMLSKVDLMNSQIFHIGSYAFYRCSKLATFTISPYIKSTGSGIVASCEKLKTIYLPGTPSPEDPSTYTLDQSIEAWLHFAKDAPGNLRPSESSNGYRQAYVYGYLPNAAGNSWKSVDITAVNIPNSISEIKQYAFHCMPDIKSINIPSSVTTFGNGAFYLCENLESINIDSIEHWLTLDLYDMSYYWYGHGAGWHYKDTSWLTANPMAYASKLYVNGELVEDLVIPDGIENIPGGRFIGCESIKSVTFSDSVRYVGQMAFYNCANLKVIHINKDFGTTTSYYAGCDMEAFGQCYNLQHVYYDNDLFSWFKIGFEMRTSRWNSLIIDSNPLRYATYFHYKPKDSDDYILLTDLILPTYDEDGDSYSIPAYAFTRFKGLMSVSIPETLLGKIDAKAFEESGLTHLTIPSQFFSNDENISIIKDRFNACPNLLELNISDYDDSDESIITAIKTALPKIKNITFGLEAETNIENIDGFRFYKDKTSETGILLGYMPRTSSISDIELTMPKLSYLYAINDKVFYSRSELISVDLNDAVSEINSQAFERCVNLSDIAFKSPLKYLGYAAFRECLALSSVAVSGDNLVIGNYAFEGCTALTTIIFGLGVKVIGSYLFHNREIYDGGKSSSARVPLANVYISKSVNQFCRNAFASSSSGYTLIKIKNVYYSGSISNWCNNIIFESQSSNPLALERGVRFYLQDITHQYNEVRHLILPEDVESLPPYIFYYCTRFNQLTILGQLKAISETAFAHESYPDVKVKFTDVYINDIKSWCQTYIPTASANPLNGANLHIKDANSDNYILATKIELPLYTQELRSYIFYGCKSIETITLNPYLEFIGENALNSTYLKNIEYNGTINQWLEVKLPYQIINSTSPPNIKVLKDGAYSNIVDIDLTDYNITHIYRGTFEYSKTLKSIKFPKTLKSLDDYAFRGCNKLSHVEFTGTELKVLPNYLFSQTALDIFDIPDGVESVGYYSLNTKSYLKSITLPKSVKNIGNIGATPGLTEEHPFKLYIDDLAHFLSLPASGSGLAGIFRYHLRGKYVSLYLKNASGSYDELHTLQIPESISDLSSYSIIGNNIKEVLIPESVSFIADDAFGFNLTSLKSLILPETLKYDRHLEVLDTRFYLPEPNFNDPDAEQLYTIKDGCAYIKTLNNDYFYLYKASIDATEEIEISTSTKYIGPQAFAGCKNITKIVIPDSVINIGYEAFKDCTGLTDIQLPLNPDPDLSIDGNAFITYASSTYTPLNYQTGSQLVTTEYANGCYLGNEDNPYLMLLSVNKSTIDTDSEITIDDQLVNLPKNTIRVHKDTQYLSSCLFGSEATNVIFEADVLQIKHIPFRMLNSSSSYKIFTADLDGFLSIPTSNNCTHAANSWLLYSGTDINSATVVTDFHIPEGIKRLNRMFYEYGSSLRSIYIPHTLNQLYDYELDSDNIDVYYNGTLQDWCKLDKASGWTYKGISLHLKHNIEDLNYYAVADLDIIEIKDIEEVKAYSFCGVKTKSEAQLKFDNNLKIIGKSAFAGTPIKTIIFGDSLEYIDSSAFSSCTNINVLEFPPSLKTISSSAFYGCSELSDIHILGSTHIGSSAFSSCSKLQDIDLGENIQAIDSNAFSSSICKHIDIPTSCKNIGATAFSSQVTSIDINSREVLINPKAFSSSVNQITINHDTLLYDSNWGAYNAKVLYKDSPEYFSQGFEFKAINDDEEAFEIIGIGSCVDTYLLIPPKYRQRPVITIKDSAFANNTKIKGLKLSSKNLNIEANAFKNCSNLDYVNCNKLDPCTLDATALSGCNLTDLRIEVPKNALDIYKAADGWKDFADYITSNYYILSVEKDLNYRIGNVGASLRAKTGYRGSYTFAEMSKRISDIETYFVDASDEDIIPENIKHEVDINGVIGTFSSDATASADDILENTVAYSKGEKLVGTILRNDASDISTYGAVLDIPKGYYEDTNIELKSLADGELSAPNIQISDDKIYASVTVSKNGFMDSTDASEAVYDLNQYKVAISTPQISISEDGQVIAAVDQSVSGWVTKDTTSQATFDLSESWVKKEELVSLSFTNSQSFTCFALYTPEDQSLTSEIATIYPGETKSITVPKHSTVVIYTENSGITLTGGNVGTDIANAPNMVIIPQASDTSTQYTIWGTE